MSAESSVQANPHVYPFVPFDDLSNKNFIDNYQQETVIDDSQLKAQLLQVTVPQPKLTGSSIEERILSIFLDEEYRFGSRELIEKEVEAWENKIKFFTAAQVPIQCIILGFPFKIPVPLKTDRVLPDMGECLSLYRLSTIAALITKIYSPGAQITIFTEGPFGKFTGISMEEADAYRNRVAELIKILGFEGILRVVDLAELERQVPDFWNKVDARAEILEKQYAAGDEKVCQAYAATYQTVYRIVSSRAYEVEDLMGAYNDKLTDGQVSAVVRGIQEDLRRRAHESVFKYHAYHQTRNESGAMEKFAPNALYLTVSPKPGRLGIYPIAKDVVRLPYHGVPVLQEGTGRFTIEYLIDIRRRKGPYAKVFLKGDHDPAPFYYSAQT